MSRKEALVIFAKAPLPGQVKTRLIGTLSPEEAAELQVCFLRDTFAAMQEVQEERENLSLVLCYTPVDEIEAFEAADLDGCLLLAQTGNDLGERLKNCCADLFQFGFSSIVIIGADSPTLPAEIILESFDQLENEAEVVMGPASDGGYYLIGLNSLHAGLFANINWSKPTVFAETIAAIQTLKLKFATLLIWDDIDTPEDLKILQSQINQQAVNPRATAKFLKKLAKTAKPF